MVETELLVSLPSIFSGFLQMCSFVDVNTVGLFDHMRREAFDCREINYVGGPPAHGPLLVLPRSGRMNIETPSQLILRFLFITESEIQVGIVASKLKLVKL